jgi:type IV secretory pathway VirB2 component (pilin)
MNPDVAAPNVFDATVQWLDGTILGSVAMAVGIIAVASIGLLLLSGRVDVRRAVQVILGCFILFGAPTIAAGILSAVNVGDARTTSQSAAEPQIVAYPLVPSAQRQAPTAYDPYAGAAVPPLR